MLLYQHVACSTLVRQSFVGHSALHSTIAPAENPAVRMQRALVATLSDLSVMQRTLGPD